MEKTLAVSGANLACAWRRLILCRILFLADTLLTLGNFANRIGCFRFQANLYFFSNPAISFPVGAAHGGMYFHSPQENAAADVFDLPAGLNLIF